MFKELNQVPEMAARPQDALPAGSLQSRIKDMIGLQILTGIVAQEYPETFMEIQRLERQLAA